MFPRLLFLQTTQFWVFCKFHLNITSQNKFKNIPLYSIEKMYYILNNDQYRKILLSSRSYHHQRLYLKWDGVDVSDSGGAVDLLKALISKPLALILCYDCLNWYQRMYLATGVTIRENITCVSDLLCFYFIPLLKRNIVTRANVGKGITWPDHVSSTPEHFLRLIEALRPLPRWLGPPSSACVWVPDGQTSESPIDRTSPSYPVVFLYVRCTAGGHPSGPTRRHPHGPPVPQFVRAGWAEFPRVQLHSAHWPDGGIPS